MQLRVAREASRVGHAVPNARALNAQYVTPVAAALLFLSGVAGLVYQVAWVRLLGLTFGVTVFAVSTVLAAFMGGLAIGSFVGGRRADRARRPLRVYGMVELSVAVTALLTPWAFGLLQTAYANLALVVAPSQAPLVAGTVRAVLAFAVLLVPTALMGATLPLVVRGVRNAGREVDRTRGDAWTIGLLYATNTAGAIVGCLLSGFVLIGRLGLAETIFAAAIANVVAGFGGLALAGGSKEIQKRTFDEEPRSGGRGNGSAQLARTALWAFAVSGCISLAYKLSGLAFWRSSLTAAFTASY